MCTPTKVDSWSLQSSRIAGFTPPWQIKLSHKAKGYPPISRQHLPTRSPRSPSQVIRGLLACQKTTSHKQQTGQVAHLHQGLSLNLTVALLEIYNTRCFMTFSYHKSMDWKRMDDTHTHRNKPIDKGMYDGFSWFVFWCLWWEENSVSMLRWMCLIQLNESDVDVLLQDQSVFGSRKR